MIRGTTPKHIFTLPFHTDAVKECRVLYAQGDDIVLTKALNDCDKSENDLIVHLTQEETFLFDSTNTVKLQLRVLTFDGEVVASKPMCITVTKCLGSDEVLS